MTDREMSLREWVLRLPDHHLARRQFQNVVRAYAEMAQWLDGKDKPPRFVERVHALLREALSDACDVTPMAEDDTEGEGPPFSANDPKK